MCCSIFLEKVPTSLTRNSPLCLSNLKCYHFKDVFEPFIAFFAKTKISIIWFLHNYSSSMIMRHIRVQLNKYETDPCFLKNLQCGTILIHVFCKNCEPEIVLQECKSKQKQFQIHNSYKICEKSNKLSYCFGKIEENWKYEAVSYLFSCMLGRPKEQLFLYIF